MATKDQIDQDALAAEWGLALESDTGAAPTGADAAAAAPADDAAAQWAAMADDPGGLQSAKGGAERILNQEEIDSLLGFSLADVSLNDNSGIRAIINFGDGFLRAVADVGNRVRSSRATDDDQPAQFHFGQCRSFA